MILGGDTLSVAIAEFGLRLLAHLANRSSGTNLVISPIGLFQLLSLFAFHPDEAVRREMRKSLQLPPLQDDILNSLYCHLGGRLPVEGRDTELLYTTALWAGTAIPDEAPLLQLAERWGITLFSGPEVTAAQMQNWALEQTRGLITSSTSPPEPENMVLINAVYFQGKWQSPFRKIDTQDRFFYRSGGLPKKAPLMRQEETRAVCLYRGVDFDAARIPYRSDTDHEFVLHILLPHQTMLDRMIAKDSLSSLLNQFTLRDWDTCQANYSPAVVDLILPRITFRQTHELESVLIGMGMRQAFDVASPQITPLSPRIERLLQKTYLSMDEEGTTAAALTEMVAPGASWNASKPQIEKFHADRPFMFLLSEEESGLLVFAGVIHDPTE